MDPDAKIPLNRFIEDSIHSAEVGTFDFPAFAAQLQRYGYSMPGYLSPVYAQLAIAPKDQTKELLNQFIRGVFDVPVGAEGLKQFIPDVEIQSSLPNDPDRIQAIRDAQEATKTIYDQTKDRLSEKPKSGGKSHRDWTERVVKNFGDQLRAKQRADALSLNDTEIAAVKKTAEQLIENPVIARSREEAKQKLAERLAMEKTFSRFREAARQAAEATLATESIDPVYVPSVVIEAVSPPDVRGAGPILHTYAEAVTPEGEWNHEKLEEITRASRIAAVATNPPRDTSNIPLTDAFVVHRPEAVSRDATINHAFSVTLTNTLSDRGVEAMKEHLGKSADDPSFHQFIQRSRQEAIARSGGAVKNKVSGFIVTSNAPDRDMQSYLETIYRTSGEMATPNPEAFFAAKAHANHPDHFHFEYLPSPFGWISAFGKKSAARSAAKSGIGAAAGAAAKLSSKELGTSILLKLGLSAKVASFFGGPVGWVAGIGLTVFPGLWDKIGTGVGLATEKVANGAISSVANASKGISGLVGDWLGGNIKYKDPNATNALLLAATPLFIAIIWLPFAIAYFRNQFIPIGGGPPDGTPDIEGSVIDCSLAENKTDPLCTFTACVPSASDPNSCKWPTTGYVTQGPHTETTCGGNAASSSHDAGTAANGIDFGGGPGSSGVTQVITVRSGKVDVVVDGCGLNSGKIGNTCGGGYGNYVIVVSDDGYRIIFGHLAPGIPVSVGQRVNAGDPIGKMDQTGNSTGSHLHFGVLSGGSVLDLIPPNDPAALPEQINHCLLSCGKPCPGGGVSP